MAERTHLVIIGGGIIGLATALALCRLRPGLCPLILEKEDQLAAHQTGHNSGVIHSGIYYRPGSLKAQLCVAGARRMVEFCREQGLPYEICGKVVVATHPSELPRLEELHRRAVANGVPGVEMIDPERLRELEPHAAGLQALRVPGTGIADFAAVARCYADLVRDGGGEVRMRAGVRSIVRDGDEWRLECPAGTIHARFLINCAGLHCDRIARQTGAGRDIRIIPFRGEYYELRRESAGLIRNLIYPVPDPAFPFLGVHFTRTIHGGVEAGPNAVLSLKREGYGKLDLSLRDARCTLEFPGFWRMAAKYWRTGFGEMYRSFSKRAFTRALRRLLPDLREEDLVPGGSGVRAQAVDRHGRLLDDFWIESSAGALHVLNAPSPAATASLPIGETIASRAVEAFM